MPVLSRLEGLRRGLLLVGLDCSSSAPTCRRSVRRSPRRVSGGVAAGNWGKSLSRSQILAGTLTTTAPFGSSVERSGPRLCAMGLRKRECVLVADGGVQGALDAILHL